MKMAAVDKLQIGFGGWAGSPTNEGDKEISQSGEGYALGEVGCRHDEIRFFYRKNVQKGKVEMGFFLAKFRAAK
jgi:hypothetical protein